MKGHSQLQEGSSKDYIFEIKKLQRFLFNWNFQDF